MAVRKQVRKTALSFESKRNKQEVLFIRKIYIYTFPIPLCYKSQSSVKIVVLEFFIIHDFPMNQWKLTLLVLAF